MTDKETALVGRLTKELWEDERSLDDLTRKAESHRDCLNKVIDALREHKECNLGDDGILSFAKPGSGMYYHACLYPDAKEICDLLNGINNLKQKITKAEAELQRLKPR